MNQSCGHNTSTVMRMLMRRLATLCAGIVLCMSGAACAESQADSEYRVKAAFLYNFTRFTSWPDSGDKQFNLCILGDSPFNGELENLSGKSVHDRPLVISYPQSPQESTHCHTVFISRARADDLEEIIGSLGGRPVLTVSDIDDFTERGGIIGMYTFDNKVRFSINLENATQSGLSISSKLLSLASTIRMGD
jgi:hypothetical protein